MPIEEVDRVDPEPLERSLGDLLMFSGPLSRADHPGPPFGSGARPNFMSMTTRPLKGSSASPTSSSFVNGP